MSFQEEVGHFNVHGNVLNIPSILIAQLICKLKHKN
ncbi:DUF3949 domain-containing protein [Radiobacillus deserti]